MARKCTTCGQDNDETSLRCACGNELPVDAAASAPTLEPSPPSVPLKAARGFGLRNLGFLLWAFAFFPLLLALRSHLPTPQLYRCLIGLGGFFVPAGLAFFLLGKEQRRMVFVWRIVFVVWLALLFPLLFTVVDGIAGEGWPQGRFNRALAHMLILIFIMIIPTFLAGLAALIRAVRVAAVFALLSGVAYLATSPFLFRAAKPIKDLLRPLVTVVDVIAVWSKILSYVCIPVGVGLIVGGILTLRAARSRNLPS